MNQNDYFGRDHGYPPDVCPEMALYFDSDEMRDRMLCAHIVLTARVADAVIYLCDNIGINLADVPKHGLHDAAHAAASLAKSLIAVQLYGEMDGLCCALRTISGTKYMGIDFTDPAWVEEHRSKP